MKKSIPVQQVDGHLLTTGEVIERLGVSRSTLYRSCKSGIYPKPVYIGSRALRWRSRDIQALIDGGVK